ncbi:MAG: hypothetical protein HUU20_15665 [Pirellulales bacterium]|nr:hypothetical protein [Pirellulales bacterium]
MARLLISVRDVQEARVARECGADLIDVKEPSRGPLGAADFDVVGDVVREVAGRTPVSMALGELLQWLPCRASQLPEGLTYAKMGMAGTIGNSAWLSTWRLALESLPNSVLSVAVAYADWFTAGAPQPLEIAVEAAGLGCSWLLIDTFSKSSGWLLECISFRELGELVSLARQRRLGVVLAGSLSEQTIPMVLPLEPDYVAVRGAACCGGRLGCVEAARVERLARLLA